MDFSLLLIITGLQALTIVNRTRAALRQVS
jgi:hypothetical protein